MPLTDLNIAGTRIQYLKFLQNMHTLKSVNVRGTPVKDLTPLAGLKLTTLGLNPATVEKGLDALKGMRTLQYVVVDTARCLEAPEFWRVLEKGEFKK